MKASFSEKVALQKSLIRQRTTGGVESGRLGDVAREFGLTDRALRFYEERGLITSALVDRRRTFDSRQRKRIEIIANLKKFGLPLADIKHLLDMYEEQGISTGFIHSAHRLLDKQASVLDEELRQIDAKLEALHVEAHSVREQLAELENEQKNSQRVNQRIRKKWRY